MKPTINLPITGIVLTYNSQQTLESALKSIGFCREIIVVDQESTDQTRTIARQHGAKVIEGGEPSFAKRRNLGLHAATQSWLFYLDSDEVVTPSLAQEIKQVVESHRDGVYLIKRRNFFLGREMYQDRVERLFARDRLHGWAGVVHEHPLIEGERLSITQPLIHRTHTDITSMLAKTNAWSEMGAALLLRANHPPISWWRLVRVALTSWWRELSRHQVYRYGRVGWFEAYFQMVDILIVYTKLWERQPHKT